MKGVVIAGAGSGVGKTSITTGLLSKLSKSMNVQAYKVGPDFIDPMYHSAVTGRPSRNLDAFMMSHDMIRNLVGFSSKGSDLCVVEGVRGLFEGLTGTTDECSTAEMAKILGFPVILVMNARSLTRSAAAMINGFMGFDKDLKISGVILNNVSGQTHERKLMESIEKYTDAEVVGVVRRDIENATRERHLGLITEDSRDKGKMDALERLVDRIDENRIMDMAETTESDLPTASPYLNNKDRFKVAVPFDDAYCFYYRENIECMQASGADIITFRPTENEMIPDADIYYLGGGYPELHGESISSNTDFLEGLKNVSDEGRVVIGECGGLMTMCSHMTSADGKRTKMAGIFDADSKITNNRHGPSYMLAENIGSSVLSERYVKGHEFHYSEVEFNRMPDFMFKVTRGTGICDGMDGATVGKSIGSYMHQHALSYKDWAGMIRGWMT